MEQHGNALSKMMWILLSVLGVSILVVMVGILFLSVKGGGNEGDSVVTVSSTVQKAEEGESPYKDGKSDLKSEDIALKGSKSDNKDIAPTDISFEETLRESQDYPGLKSNDNTKVTMDGDNAIVQWSPKTKKSKLFDKKREDESPVKKSTPEVVKKNVPQTTTNSVEDEMLNASAKKIKTTVYWIQVASFTDSYKAEVLRKDFMENGISSVISTTEVNGDTWYRVRVGTFNSKEEAGYYQDQIAGFADINKTYIVKGSVMKAVIN